MTFLEPAQKLLARGKPIFPVDRGTKRPLVEWKQFQERLPTEGELATWGTLFPDANLGMATGKLSGCVVIDWGTLGVRLLRVNNLGGSGSGIVGQIDPNLNRRTR